MNNNVINFYEACLKMRKNGDYSTMEKKFHLDDIISYCRKTKPKRRVNISKLRKTV